MAMNLPVSKNENVFSILEQSLSNQRNNLQTMEMMVGEMKSIKEDVSKQHEEIQALAKQIQDENRLLPSEIDDLYQAVVLKSINTVRATSTLEGKEFKAEVGRTRRFIWNKLNRKFGTSKYIHLPRKHFDEALEFVRTFSILDHI
ncbi:ORF6C domain-containing protein [Paenibacillus vini]|uniref:ORF6C domain-containing protein n=1 Tax=Paenibacillus vini TaxID=1476024 RepID=A0ABQ4MIW1_9BACL|nr:ORF6C domain-containing protein [Paenibacillus vini]GIP55907.1 hypothetical protein J42TS3_49420 [Paenibacillus vini]